MTGPPWVQARLAGAAYLLNLISFVPGVLILGRLVIAGDAAGTAANILAHQDLLRVGFATNLVGVAAYVAVTSLFYELFRTVDETVSRLAALFSVIGCAILAVSGFLYIAPLATQTDGPIMQAFSRDQAAAFVVLFVRLYVDCFNISFVFFGIYCLLIGWLVFRSGFLPRLLGAGLMVTGLAYLSFLSPPLARALSSYNVLPGFIAEGGLTLWLLIAGINAGRWRERREQAGVRTCTELRGDGAPP